METLLVETTHKSYPVMIGQGLLQQLSEYIPKVYDAFYIVTDENVAPHYLEPVKQALEPLGPVHEFVAPAGEDAKTLAVYSHIMDDLIGRNLGRQACVLSLGGGVVGDLAGFVAATYLRGVAFIQLPTTLLAHDSSVGGKVGINHSNGKNLIGAFYQPDAVIYDTDTFRTLSIAEWRSGFAELIKHSLLSDKHFYDELKSAFPSIPEDKAGIELSTFIRKGVAVKADIVKTDEKEEGVRAFLNFGHTLGHAIEREARLRHGEAVAIGMIFSMFLSIRKLGARLPLRQCIEWFRALGLPVEIPEGLTDEQLIRRMQYDKKRTAAGEVFILLRQFGDRVKFVLDETELKEALQNFRKV